MVLTEILLECDTEGLTQIGEPVRLFVEQSSRSNYAAKLSKRIHSNAPEGADAYWIGDSAPLPVLDVPRGRRNRPSKARLPKGLFEYQVFFYRRK